MPPQGTLVDSRYSAPGDTSPNPARNVVYSRNADNQENEATRAGSFAQGLNDLDRIARFVLAIAHSGQWTPEHVQDSGSVVNPNREQGFIAQRTVAVAYGGNDEIYIAANSLWNDDIEDCGSTKQRVIDALSAEGVARRIHFLPNPFGNGDRTFHAEMQIVRFFVQRGWALRYGEIGVSKPCCRRCAENLDRQGVHYSYWHNEPTGQYVQP